MSGAPAVEIGGAAELHHCLSQTCATLGWGCAPSADRAELLLIGGVYAVDDAQSWGAPELAHPLTKRAAAEFGALRQVIWVVDIPPTLSRALRNMVGQSLRLMVGQAALRHAPALRVNAICGSGLSVDTLSRPLAWVQCADAVTGQVLDLKG